MLFGLLLGLLATAPDSSPAVIDVVADKWAFAPDVSEMVTWRFRTPTPSKITASVYDGRNVQVREIVKGMELPAGEQKLSWDGRDENGRLAPDGYYLLTIEASAAGRTVRYDPSDQTGGTLMQASVLGYDSSKGLLRYVLPRPGLVRILLGLKQDGPILRTLVDWVARDAGERAEPWDGWDASGVVRFGTSPNLDIEVWAYELPHNAVVVKSVVRSQREAPPESVKEPDPASPIRPTFLEFPADRPVRFKGPAPRHEMYNHWMHDRVICHDPVMSVRTPRSSRVNERGATLVDAPLLLRLEVSREEAAFLQDERFEVVIYLDGVFVFEEEQGYLPFSWTLKPELLPPGEHVVTFVVRGYEGHFGSASILTAGPIPSGPSPRKKEGL